MKPRRPGSIRTNFETRQPCPKCGKPLIEGTFDLNKISGGLGLSLSPPRFRCESCNVTWALEDDHGQKGAIKLKSGYVLVPVETGEGN